MKIVIVDDEPLARENLRYLLEQEANIDIISECSNAIEALRVIYHKKPDVVFLDIQMPRITGLEMVQMLGPQHRPYIIFVTAFDEYAIQAFEEHVFDYLLKPLEKNRLSKTLQRLHHYRQKQNIEQLSSNIALKYIPCVGHNRIWLIPLGEVLYITSRMNGVYVMNNKNQEGFTELTLRTIEMRTTLVRCHRQYLINMAQLKEITFTENNQAKLVLSNGQHIPISRRYLKVFKEALGLC